ncbi:multiprotein-bridging factor 1 family protein [Methylobacterium sp. J-070]|uniref:helix-turn-helix domain-containing protein n=1 Tax=Methylobacterium sp. J-070 TaxID=2836650 RepID=UPI001FBAB730|nr:helix-turn-helix transcriptional regulator [Methylobacterium sp. J-070]MCJ2049340.1 helix-turn-helix transcriptional regulator [Methylobacterium sp. J-070]
MNEIELPEAQSRAIAQIVREALARRRISRQTLAEQARISISTLEKALAGRRPFTLATTIRLEEALGQSLRPGTGRAAEVPEPARYAPDALGSYSREGVSWLEGRYLTLRPSFGTAGALFAYRTEIAWDADGARLAFREAERIDAPFTQSGSVAVPSQSGMIYLVTNWHGQHRLAVLCRPNIQGEMYGVLTTLHPGRGTQLTPAAAPLALLPEAAAEFGYGRIGRDEPGFARYQAYLARVHDDGYARFFTTAP